MLSVNLDKVKNLISGCSLLTWIRLMTVTLHIQYNNTFLGTFSTSADWKINFEKNQIKTLCLVQHFFVDFGLVHIWTLEELNPAFEVCLHSVKSRNFFTFFLEFSFLTKFDLPSTRQIISGRCVDGSVLWSISPTGFFVGVFYSLTIEHWSLWRSNYYSSILSQVWNAIYAIVLWLVNNN